MGSCLIKVEDIRIEEAMELLLLENEEVIQAFSPHTPQKTFTDLCWLLRISVPKNASPMALSDPFPLHLSIGQMAIDFLTLLLTALF